MGKFNVLSYVISDYVIGNVTVKVCFTPAVIESFYTKHELIELIKEKKDKKTLDGIFETIKKRVLQLKVYEVWYDIIEYRGIELIWKSSYDTKTKKMGVEVLYSRDNGSQSEQVH